LQTPRDRSERYSLRERKIFEQKGFVLMARSGRPRANLEQKILAEISEDEKRLQVEVSETLRDTADSPGQMAFAAACVLHTIESGNDLQKTYCQSVVDWLLNWARLNGPHGKWRSKRDFLTDFIETHLPGWKWREQIDDGYHERRNERIATLLAESDRFSKAVRSRFVSADAPDLGMLLRLREIIPNDPTTWPTRRELKLATAIPERTIKRSVANLRPKPRKAEIIKVPLRHTFSKKGAVPLRYGPRLVVRVLNDFVNRLPEFRVDNEGRKRLGKTASLVKRALIARISRSRSST
jgi:hypothetical protein